MTTYHISGAGSDTNNGLSPDTPFRNAPGMGAASGNADFIKSPGDIIYMMDGVWQPNFAGLDVNASGTLDDPIQILAYPGTNPIIDSRTPLTDFVWTDEGGGVWSAPWTGTALRAIWVSGESLIVVSDTTTPVDGEAAISGGNLYVNANGMNPGVASSWLHGVGAGHGDCIRIRDRSHIIVDGITGYGGRERPFLIQQLADDSVLENITLKKLVGHYAKSGIRVLGRATSTTGKIAGVLIDSCDIRSMITPSGDPGGAEELGGEGVKLDNSIDGATLSRTVVRDFGHSNIEARCEGASAFAQNIKIIGNDSACPNRRYGRAIGVNGDGGCQNVDVIGNQLHDHPTRNQYGAIGGIFSGNLIYNVTGTATQGGDAGEGLRVVSRDLSHVSGLLICNNVFANIKNNGLDLYAFDEGPAMGLEQCTIANNIMFAIGGYDFAMSESGGGVVHPQQVWNNDFSGDAILDRGTVRTVSGANAQAEFSANINDAPALDADYRPQNTALVGAGRWVAGVRAYDGLPLSLHPDIGAHQNRTLPGRRAGLVFDEAPA